jgi:hypothetical protein
MEYAVSARGGIKVFMILADSSPSAVIAMVHLGNAWTSHIISTAIMNLWLLDSL